MPLLAVLACTGLGTKTDADDTDTDDTDTVETAETSNPSTGHTGGTTTADTAPETADTGPQTVVLSHWVWEVDRACWSLLETERPAQYWETFLAEGCQLQSDDTYITYADTDGFCGRWERPFAWDYAFGRDCSTDDPWILDCSAVEGCCEREVPGPTCNYYEP